MALLEDLPGDVADETGEGDKEKFALVHLDEWADGPRLLGNVHDV
jgi:hypothetical protein